MTEAGVLSRLTVSATSFSNFPTIDNTLLETYMNGHDPLQHGSFGLKPKPSGVTCIYPTIIIGTTLPKTCRPLLPHVLPIGSKIGKPSMSYTWEPHVNQIIAFDVSVAFITLFR